MNKAQANEEKQLFKVVGHNTKIARNIGGITRSELMDMVWAYSNNQKYANRVSELEGGDKRIELITFYRLCKSLNVSADFLLGLSDDYERENLEAKTAGRIFQAICGAVQESTEQICERMSGVIRHLPPYQGEMLKTKARTAVDVFNRHSHDLAFRAQYGDVLDAMSDLQGAVMEFDKFFARQMRMIEMSMMTMLDDQGPEGNKRLTMTLEQPQSEKV